MEGHQDVVHQKHLLTACNSFRLKKNEVITDKKETSFKREERKSLSDRKDVLYKRDSINKRDTKLSPVRTSRRCLPGKHIHSICIPHISLLSSSLLSSLSTYHIRVLRLPSSCPPYPSTHYSILFYRNHCGDNQKESRGQESSESSAQSSEELPSSSDHGLRSSMKPHEYQTQTRSQD